MKPECHSGSGARGRCEETITKLFRAPKPHKPEKQPQKKAASEEKENRPLQPLRQQFLSPRIPGQARATADPSFRLPHMRTAQVGPQTRSAQDDNFNEGCA